MKAKELAQELLKNPEFDVRFVVSEFHEDYGMEYRVLGAIIVSDIGYSDKIIQLAGEEI